MVIDKARFPRAKPCAEFVSPGAAQALRDLGLDSAVERFRQFPLHGFRVSKGALAISGRYQDGEAGFAAPRADFDLALLMAAVQSGATLCEQIRAVGIEEHGACVRVAAQGQAGRSIEFRSRYLIGADGINSVVSHRLGLRRPDPALKRVGIVAHIAGVTGIADLGEMHIGDGYYCGLAPFSPEVANVAMVVPQQDVDGLGRDASGFLMRRLQALESFAPRLGEATLVSPVLRIGPMAVAAASVRSGRCVLAGDAGGFYDPFTGQGIFRAIAGGREAGAAVLSALAAGDPDRAFARYVERRRHKFRGSWALERLVQQFIRRPALLDRLLRNLAVHSDLANRLVRVTGDSAPVSRVLSPAYLVRALW
jgi:flavin-dependent dehydrogenase